jgi:hypothetical protein
MPCSPSKINLHFGGTCRLDLQGPRISQERNQHEGYIKKSCVDGADIFLRIVDYLSTDHIALYPTAVRTSDSSLFTEFARIVRNEIPHVHCTTHNAVIPLYKLTGRFKSEHFR